MPSKSNERFLRADRKNRLEKHRLENTLKVFDRERSSKALEIDREKKGIAKSFDLVRKTSGRSDQGRPPRNRNDTGHLDAPVYQMGLRLSERRLMEWRAQEKELERSQSRSRSQIGSVMSLRDTNANKVNDKHVQSATSFSSEEEENSQYGSIKNLVFDPDELSRTIQEEYEALFRKCDIKIDLKYFNSYRDSKSQRRNTLQRPHTANAAIRNKGRSRSASLPVRPQTATSTNRNARESETDNIVSAVSEYSIISESDDNDDSVFEKPDQTKSDYSVKVQSNGVESGGESGSEVSEETTTIRKETFEGGNLPQLFQTQSLRMKFLPLNLLFWKE
ncbi:hypothetical protein FSP39_011116 [Pinctada imbricata]|uniref:Uncharacterized protein n=1 Tax=Pinctada imbricata TaxID=66713 RepID=A0AA88YIH5_PINIB|nr:hypothetical protein FSP39_011116 [Pinctada imbricata]